MSVANVIDLRSDTVTKPTASMRQAMADADVGDDVYEEDPTVKTLETKVAQLFQKEAALFFPTGTMANLTALLVWCERGGEAIVGDRSHIFLYEQAGAAQFGGISYRQVSNLDDGTLDLAATQAAIRPIDDVHEPMTQLICIENTHNACGGKVLPISFFMQLHTLARNNKIPVHLDGARLWNAIEVYNDIKMFPHCVDSLTVCLSKGLGAPAGSLLVGDAYFIHMARRIRKALGGGMRQVGVLAAAGLVALDDFQTTRLMSVDHARCHRVFATMNELRSHVMRPVCAPQTNLLFVQTDDSRHLCQEFQKHDILVSAWSDTVVRMAFHRDLTETHMERVISVIRGMVATDEQRCCFC